MHAFFLLAALLAVVTAYIHPDFDIKRKFGDGLSANAFLATDKALGEEVVLKISRDNTTDYLLENELEIMQVRVCSLDNVET
jgi:hypothetical protein